MISEERWKAWTSTDFLELLLPLGVLLGVEQVDQEHDARDKRVEEDDPPFLEVEGASGGGGSFVDEGQGVSSRADALLGRVGVLLVLEKDQVRQERRMKTQARQR